MIYFISKKMTGGINIKKRARNIIGLAIILMIILNYKIDAGGDGRSYSIKVNNETVCAYSNGKNVTEDFNRKEEDAKDAIIKYYGNSEIEFISLCHLGNSGSMTVEFIVNNKCYTILWEDGRIDSLNSIKE